MTSILKSACFSTILILPAVSIAEIDSGGGKSSDGFLYSHSSIGSPFATVATFSCSTINHPGLIEVLYPDPPDVELDSDGNGLPDAWELRYFGHIGVDPDADADNDGTSNLMEYLAGTNPRDSSCVFRPQGHFEEGIFQMPIKTATGRSYTIWASRDLNEWVLQETLTAAQIFFCKSG